VGLLLGDDVGCIVGIWYRLDEISDHIFNELIDSMGGSYLCRCHSSRSICSWLLSSWSTRWGSCCRRLGIKCSCELKFCALNSSCAIVFKTLLTFVGCLVVGAIVGELDVGA
jgi:hypothetical protein